MGFADNERQLLLGLLEIGARSRERAAFRGAVPIGFSAATAMTLEHGGFVGRIVGRRHDLDQFYLTPDGEAAARRLVRELAR